MGNEGKLFVDPDLDRVLKDEVIEHNTGKNTDFYTLYFETAQLIHKDFLVIGLRNGPGHQGDIEV